jgi:putative mRNA 3-end processing factor
VRIEGTILGCDVASGTGVGFVSNAFTTPPARRRFRPGSRTQWIATAETLALLGRSGERLARAALVAPPGRPFTLGDLRIEVIPQDAFPGASAVLVEGRSRRWLYTGPLGRAAASGAALRSVDALCVDATFGHISLPPPDETWAAFHDQLANLRKRGHAAIVFVPLGETAAPVLVRWPSPRPVLRAHRAIVALAGQLRAAGFAAPVPSRFAGKLDPGDVLLWPADQRGSPQLRHLDGAPTETFFVSGWARQTPTAGHLQVAADHAIPWSSLCDREALLTFARTTGARDIATAGAGATALAEDLARELGQLTYALVPPTQIGLFGDGTSASRFPASPFEETRGK